MLGLMEGSRKLEDVQSELNESVIVTSDSMKINRALKKPIKSINQLSFTAALWDQVTFFSKWEHWALDNLNDSLILPNFRALYIPRQIYHSKLQMTQQISPIYMIS